jgi:hypothetical protein
MRPATPPASSRFHGKTLCAASAVFVLLAAASGCSPRRASYTPVEVHTAPARSSETVEVLLDQKPSKPFRVVGELHASTLESPKTIELMRNEAARAGLDGIYWIDCSAPGSGRCTAKGFVYERDEAPRQLVPGGSDSIALRAAQ